MSSILFFHASFHWDETERLSPLLNSLNKIARTIRQSLWIFHFAYFISIYCVSFYVFSIMFSTIFFCNFCFQYIHRPPNFFVIAWIRRHEFGVGRHKRHVDMRICKRHLEFFSRTKIQPFEFGWSWIQEKYASRFSLKKSVFLYNFWNFFFVLFSTKEHKI